MNLKYLILSCFAVVSYSSQLFSQSLNEIRQLDEVHSCHLGPAGQKSADFHLADSLLSPLSADSLFALTTDSSYTLKYYAFIHLLGKNDSMAFEVVKFHVNDSTQIYTHFSCIMSSRPFNHLLIEEYVRVFELKYKSGGWTSGNCITYHFPKSSKRCWRAKKREFNDWMEGEELESLKL